MYYSFKPHSNKRNQENIILPYNIFFANTHNIHLFFKTPFALFFLQIFSKLNIILYQKSDLLVGQRWTKWIDKILPKFFFLKKKKYSKKSSIKKSK